jgi:hypothetical protein
MRFKGMVLTATTLVTGFAMAGSAFADVNCTAMDATDSGSVFAHCVAGPDSASANNVTGILRAKLYSSGAVDAQLFHNFTVTGMVGNNGYLIPVTMTIDGSYGASGGGDIESAANLAVSDQIGGSEGEVYSFFDPGIDVDEFETLNYGSDAVFDIISSNKNNISVITTVYAYVSNFDPNFDLVAQIILDGQAPNFSDFSHTAALQIDLPPGLAFSPATPDFSAAPEPATWTMMILGLGAVGGASRLRGRSLAAKLF